MSAKEQIRTMLEKAKAAQKKLEDLNQKEVDYLTGLVAFEVVREENSRYIANLAVEESGMGNFDDKHGKIQKKVRGAWRDIKDQKTIGKIEENPETGIVKYAKPVGIIGALIPCTNPEATPPIKGLFTLKGRNAIIFAPHPRTKKTTFEMVEIMRQALKKAGYPEDIFQCIPEPTLDLSAELMKQCDLIVATGGGGMVKSAYSSGTPAYGVGPGNAAVIVDETADIKDAAHKIMQSKTFDNATSCSTENSIIVESSIYDDLLKALQSEGGYLVDSEEKEKLKAALWKNGVLNTEIVAGSPGKIAEAAGIKIFPETRFFLVEEEGIGKDYPFSGEKLTVVLTVYRYQGFENALKKVDRILNFQGLGHSCGIHSFNQDHIDALGQFAKASRIMVRQPQCYANSGDWTNGMPFTLSLGCGTWGGNITTENIGMKHFLNISWVAHPIEPRIPTDDELFAPYLAESRGEN